MISDRLRPNYGTGRSPLGNNDGEDDFKIDEDRVEAARKILNGGSAKVYKSTRSGFTTSAVFAAANDGKRILCISPTHRILNDTIKKKLVDITASVLPNCFCLKLRDLVKRDKLLRKLPLPLEDCEKCDEQCLCPVCDILYSNGQIITITYKKLEALMLSPSTMAKEMLEKISSVDIVFLDEAHSISLPTVVGVPAFAKVEIPFDFQILNKIMEKFEDLNEKYREEVDHIKTEGETGHWTKHLSKRVPNDDSLNFQLLVAGWEELIQLAKNRHILNINDETVLLIRDIIALISGHWLAITYLKGDGDEGSAYFTCNYWISVVTLKEFLSKHVSRATHIYSSGTLIEPYKDFFSELSGKYLQDVIYPDLRKTNSMMRIYPDKRRLGAKKYYQELDRIVDQISEILKEHPKDEIYIVGPSVRKSKALMDRLEKKFGYKIFVDHYRSDKTMGVENKARICIAVGLAELPANSYDHQAMGNSQQEMWLDSQRLRREEVDAGTWQCWSRVKDPNGEVESSVYCIGVRADQVRDVVTWGPGRRLKLKELKPYRLNNRTRHRPVFEVKVDTLIDPPRLYAEKKTSNRLDRHNAGEYIDRIEEFDLGTLDFLVDKMPGEEIKRDISKTQSNRLGEIDLDIIYRKKVDILPINTNRENVQRFAIYNNPSNDIEEWMTCIVLFYWFFTRSDYVASQARKADGHGKFVYEKRELMHKLFEPALLYTHLRGRITLGFYQIRLDDTVKWICFDVDDHKGIRNPEEVMGEVLRLVNVLKKYKIPFLLEASGSPNSYHLWILLEPTKTYKAYRFSRQIKSEANVECEVFPKQKHLTNRGKFGNLVKPPLGINRKNEVKSQFLDPSTFQPYSGEVPIPGYVRLREVPEDTCEIKEKSKKLRSTSDYQREPIQSPNFVGENFRYCMRSLLVDNVSLDGSEGHLIRVAIAAEAYNTGLSVEESVNLFKNQPDFDEGITRAHVEYIFSRGYNRFSCRTLKDQCSFLVSPYCSEC